jgi:hypothetical protein
MVRDRNGDRGARLRHSLLGSEMVGEAAVDPTADQRGRVRH